MVKLVMGRIIVGKDWRQNGPKGRNGWCIMGKVLQATCRSSARPNCSRRGIILRPEAVDAEGREIGLARRTCHRWVTKLDSPVSMENFQTPPRSVSAMRTKLSVRRRRVMPFSKSAMGMLPFLIRLYVSQRSFWDRDHRLPGCSSFMEMISHVVAGFERAGEFLVSTISLS